MSRAPRRSGNPVTLFPFLAVLLCTMGSLSLLLLVTTHRIRRDAVVWAEAESLAQAEVDPLANPVAYAKSAPPKSDSGPLAPSPAPEAEPTSPAPQVPPAPVIDLNAQMERIVGSLAQRHDARLDALRADQSALQSTHQKVEQAARQLSDAEQQLAQSRSDQRRNIAQAQEIKEQRVVISGQIHQAEQRLRELEQRRANASTKYAFVPYDGVSGTVRRPILIECTNKGLRFLPEGILLSAAELDGFAPEFNPLLAGTRSLVDYWSRQARDPQEPKPYVLLIVRPSGGTAFYAARKLLSPLEQPSGYELLGETEPLELPAADPRAVAACRRAVDTTLANRNKTSKQSVVARGSAQGDDSLPSRSIAQDRTPGNRPTSHGSQTSQTSADTTAAKSAPAAVSVRGGRLSGSPPSCDSNSDVRKTLANQPAHVRSAPVVPTAGQKVLANAGISPTSGTAAPKSTALPSVPLDGTTGSNPEASQHSASGVAGAAGTAGDSSDPFPTFGLPAERSTNDSAYDRPDDKRRWGIYGPRATIGFQRNLTIYVDAQQIVVGNEAPIIPQDGELRDQLAARVLYAIQADTRSWGRPPERFYWSPALHFIVSPGGNQHYERLKGPLASCGLSSTVEHRLDPYKPSRGPE